MEAKLSESDMQIQRWLFNEKITSYFINSEEEIKSCIQLAEIKDGKDDLHICPTCLQTLYKPIECVSCDTCYCMSCKDKWEESNKTCPNCRRETEFKDMNRLLMKHLNGLSVVCKSKDCELDGKVITYEQLVKHAKTCFSSKYKFRIGGFFPSTNFSKFIFSKNH